MRTSSKNTFLTNEVQRPRDLGKSTKKYYTHKFIFTQMNTKEGIKEIGDDTAKSIIAEFTQFGEK